MSTTHASPIRTLLAPWLPLLALAGGPGCKGEDTSKQQAPAAADAAPDAPPQPEATEGNGTTGGAEAAEAEDSRGAGVDIPRREAAAPVAGKGAKSLGFRVDAIDHLFALAASAKLPDWAASGEGSAEAARDDDLDTSWRCQQGGGSPCVLGLGLPEPAKLEAVRLYSAAGPRWRDYKANPRIASVRVHTDAGFVDAELPDGANHGYIKFDEAIETQSVAIEVLGLHGDGTTVHLSEVELYGTEGVPRPPLELDPARAWVSWETSSWSGSGTRHTIRQTFVEFARPGASASEDAPPSSLRFMRASAVFGRAGDDYLLFERMFGADCSSQRGSYVLFDRRSRMYYPIGDLGGVGAQVYRHAEGRGFAVGWASEGRFTVKGVVEQAGELKWKRPPKQPPADPAALLREWGFDSEPLERGATLASPPPACHRAAVDELEPVERLAKVDDLEASEVLICPVGDARLYATAACDQPARAYLVDGAGKLAGKYEGQEADARGFRLRHLGERALLELSIDGGETSSLWWIEGGTWLELRKRGGLSVRPPADCERCVDAFTDPDAPELSELAGETGTDTGEG